MNAAAYEPTLADLRSYLVDEEDRLEGARIGIDNFQRREFEMDRIRSRIRSLKAQIAQAEATDGR